MLWVSVFAPSRHVTSRKAHDDNVPDPSAFTTATLAPRLFFPHAREQHLMGRGGKWEFSRRGKGEKLDNVLFDYSA